MKLSSFTGESESLRRASRGSVERCCMRAWLPVTKIRRSPGSMGRELGEGRCEKVSLRLRNTVGACPPVERKESS